MPVPVITQPESPRILAAGVSFSLTLSATESPTAWYGSNLPGGLSIGSAGNITGAPLAAGYANASFIANNASGNSSAVYLEFLTLAAADGAPPDSLARRVDWDLDTGKLTLVGKGDAQPAAYAPASGDESATLIALKKGDVFPLSIGLKVGGVLVEPTVDTIDVTLKAAEDEAGLSIARDAATIRKTGSGTAPRHEARIQITDAQVDTWVSDGGIEDARGQAFDGLMELTLTSGTIRRTSQSASVRVYRSLRDLGVFPVGVWAAGAALPESRYAAGAGGTTSTAYVAGGYLSAYSATTRTFDGQSWSAGNALGTARGFLGGGGTQSAGIVFGGQTTGPGNSAVTEKSSGGTWTASGSLATARWGLAGVGTASAALAAGGTVTSTPSAVAEKFNGTSWSSAGNLATARHEPRLIGTQSAALCLGGTNNASTFYDSSESYNGSAWSSGPNLSNARAAQGGTGTTTAGLMWGGFTTGSVSVTTCETFDGLAFSSTGSLTAVRSRSGAIGTATAAIAAGGQSVATTEVYYV